MCVCVGTYVCLCRTLAARGEDALLMHAVHIQGPFAASVHREVEVYLITPNSGMVKEHKGVNLGSGMRDQRNANAMVVSY